MERKKLAIIYLLKILEEESDENHAFTQAALIDKLERDYGIKLERKAVARNLDTLEQLGYDVAHNSAGYYLNSRTFEDSELRILIDGVLCSKYITTRYSKDLINKLCKLSNVYFKAHVKSIYSVDDWDKSENAQIFNTIEIIDEAIEKKKRVNFIYNKYGTDKKLHKTTDQRHIASPYQLILKNQRYYLMALNERWKDIVFYRLDRITEIQINEKPLTPIRKVKGYEAGINYKELSDSLPYLYNDKIEEITMKADLDVVDQVIDWFGKDIRIKENKEDSNTVLITLKASQKAMEHWAMQYINYIEIVKPDSLRIKIKKNLQNAYKKYNKRKVD